MQVEPPYVQGLPDVTGVLTGFWDNGIPVITPAATDSGPGPAAAPCLSDFTCDVSGPGLPLLPAATVALDADGVHFLFRNTWSGPIRLTRWRVRIRTYGAESVQEGFIDLHLGPGDTLTLQLDTRHGHG